MAPTSFSLVTASSSQINPGGRSSLHEWQVTYIHLLHISLHLDVALKGFFLFALSYHGCPLQQQQHDTRHVHFKFQEHYSRQHKQRLTIIKHVFSLILKKIHAGRLSHWIEEVEITSTIHRGSWPGMRYPDYRNHLTIIYWGEGQNK
ncbi:hypothetical protein K474DRAFT_1680220 [Panus rudis PR-1116 ss-1]|nr:hypothetical protein K474DRAFT_1680220 [Panus rudis PR-1116 ss-1]